MIRKSKKIFN